MLTNQQKDDLADLMETLIEKEPDQAKAMNWVASEFAEVGLILDSEIVRKDEGIPVFVDDLMRDNDLMGDWLNLKAENGLDKPLQIRTLGDLMVRVTI